jgi:hypothetical protein
MATLHEIVITRPSLDALHPFEVQSKQKQTPLGPFTYRNEFTGMTSMGYIESISWSEVFSRLGELRSDLRAELEELGESTITGNTATYGNGPDWNPFSLTWTMIHEYSDKDSAVANINRIWTKE